MSSPSVGAGDIDMSTIVQREMTSNDQLNVAPPPDLGPIVSRSATADGQPAPHVITVTAAESEAVDPLPSTEIKSVGDAVSFLVSSHPENARRAEEMNHEQALRFESYSEEKAVLSFVPSGIGKGLDAVGNAVQAVIPAPIALAATAAGDQFTKVAEKAADVINNAPYLVINTIPNSVMSHRTKQLIFVDFSNTVRSFFHTNVLAMPYVFSQTGVVMGLFIMTFTALACEFATELFLLAKYSLPDPSKVNGYGDVVRLNLGDWYPTFNIFYGSIHLLGFQVFAAKNTQVMLRSVFGVTDTSRGYVLGMIIPSTIAIPLCLMKSAHNQRPLSIVSNTLVIISLSVLLLHFPYDAFDVSYGPSTISNLGVAFGVVVYAFTGIGSVIPVERTMPGPRYQSLLRPAVALSFILLVLFGISGYVSYGANTCSVITMSLHEGSTKTAVSVMLFIASIAIIPQQLFPFAEVIDRRIIGLSKMPSYMQLNANIGRLIAVTLCACVAYVVPYYGLMSALSGAVACSIMGFVVPGALERHRRLRRSPSLQWYEYILAHGVIGLGLFILGGCSTAAIYQLIDVVDRDYVATCY